MEAGSQISLLYSCNQNYIVQTIVSIESVLYNNRKESIIIYMVHDHVEKSWLDLLQKRVENYKQKLVVMCMEQLVSGNHIEMYGRHPQTIFSKLFAEKFAEERILYLDSDTVVNGSLKELFQEEFDEYVAGVMMPYSEKKKQSAGLKKDSVYICDGILLINVKRWKQDSIGKKCISYAEEHAWNPFGLSEGVINTVCQGHIRKIAPKYNLMGHMLLFNRNQIMRLFHITDYYTEKELAEAKNKPVIVHYLNELYNRPWNKKSDHPYKFLYLQYLKMAGLENTIENAELACRTRLTRIMIHALPFEIFAGVYQIIHKES